MPSREKRKASVGQDLGSGNTSGGKRKRHSTAGRAAEVNSTTFPDKAQNPSALKRIQNEGDWVDHVPTPEVDTNKTVPSGSKSKYRRKRVDCWGPERIEKRRQELLEELEKERSSLSVSRIKRIKARLSDLAKAALGLKQVGGQLAKVSKHKSKGKGSRDRNGAQPSQKHEFKRRRDAVNAGAIKRVKKICLRCRKRGHILQDCPLNKTGGNASEVGPTGICFNCGKNDHTLKDCRKARSQDGSLPFASCFVCNKAGHISSQCPDSKTGKYPKGGSCRTCGSIYHLQMDCPEYQKQQQFLKNKRVHNTRKGHDQQIRTNSQKSHKSETPLTTEEDADTYWSEMLNQ